MKRLIVTVIKDEVLIFSMILTCDWALWQCKLHRGRQGRDDRIVEPHIHSFSKYYG